MSLLTCALLALSLDAIPKTASGKILRKDLRVLAKELRAEDPEQDKAKL